MDDRPSSSSTCVEHGGGHPQDTGIHWTATAVKNRLNRLHVEAKEEARVSGGMVGTHLVIVVGILLLIVNGKYLYCHETVGWTSTKHFFVCLFAPYLPNCCIGFFYSSLMN